MADTEGFSLLAGLAHIAQSNQETPSWFPMSTDKGGGRFWLRLDKALAILASSSAIWFRSSH